MKANMTTFKLLAALLFAATLSVSNVHASTITVMNNNDSGPNSLRDAIATASAGDMIQFAAAVTGVITLTSSELLINKSITISGPGANILAVDGNHARRVFHITSGNTVTISGLSITNGNAGNSFGGGIFNDISGGSATLTLSNCTVSGNRAASIGGGICNVAVHGSATLMVSNCTVSGNSSAVNSGGGICSVSGDNGSVTLTVNNSTFSGNSASFSGGAIVSSPNGSGCPKATLTLNNNTFTGNSAFHAGGIGCGVTNGVSSTLTISNTILKAGALGVNILTNDTVTSLGYNLSSDAAGGDGTTGPGGFLNATGDIRNTDPQLGPLQGNGGPTFTHALLTGSPAIDAGDPNFTPPPFYDQRGTPFVPVANGRIDIGSFEVQCLQQNGYWKNNTDAWQVSSLMLGGKTYTKAELLTILSTPTKGDASLILADQLIAAKLNIANGADGTPVTSTITHADSVLSG